MVMNDINFNACKVYSLSWSEYSSSLSMAAQNLRNKEDLIDVTVSAGGKNFPAHRLVLSAASPLLMDLLKNTTCQHPILMLAGISASDLETILDFVYRGEINIDSEKLPSLLQAAQFLDIKALSPAALVLNSLQPPLPTFNSTNEEETPDNSTTEKNENKQIEKKKETESQISQQKRKRVLKPSEGTSQKARIDSNGNKSITKIFKESNSNLGQNSPLQAKVDEPASIQESVFAHDEKKIISDLPVNCKLCGVTIRQSRNLRRHMDQMHSKVKQKNDDPKEKKISSKNMALKNDSFLDFSDDSFNQFTEEIFNYTRIPDSISNSLTISSNSSIDGCLIEDMIPNSSTSTSTSATSSTLLCALSAGPVPQFNALLSDLCYTVTANSTETHKKTNNTQGNENFEYNGLDVESNNDNAQDIIAFKELDNQLLSACFCPSENEV